MVKDIKLFFDNDEELFSTIENTLTAMKGVTNANLYIQENGTSDENGNITSSWLELALSLKKVYDISCRIEIIKIATAQFCFTDITEEGKRVKKAIQKCFPELPLYSNLRRFKF